ncbi:MAG: acyloxyacyl hydrolase [Pelagibacterales bacterium]|nr:acyloxyacyl hydrolase [Pelagibacterales bacterium]
MRKIASSIVIALLTLCFVNFESIAEDSLNETVSSNETELNFFTGMFDFSDDKQSSGLLGLQHQNEELFRNSFLGKLSPITGGFFTEKSAFYLYSGVQAEYELGFLTITPSFAPGYYNYGNGKDLGYPLEFKSEVQMSFNLSDSSHLGMSYNHISNASLGTKNPGANSYMLNFLKQF